MDRAQLIAKDYRRWLLQEFEDRRNKNAAYSIMAFSRDLNINKSTLYRVLALKQHLSLRGITNLDKQIGLTKAELQSIRSQARRGASKTRSFDIALKSAQQLVDKVGRYSDRSHYDLSVIDDLLKNANDVYSELILNCGDSIDLQLALATCRSASAHSAICSGEFRRAIELADEAIRSLEVLVAAFPQNIGILSALADAVSQAAYSHELIGQTREHLQCHEYAARVMAKAVETEKTTANRSDLCMYLYNVGRAHAKQGNFQISIDRFQEALIHAEYVPTPHEDGLCGVLCQSYAYLGLSRSHSWIGQYSAAVSYVEKSIECQSSHLEVFPKSDVTKVRFVDSSFEHAANCIRLGKDVKAEQSLEKMKAMIPELINGGYDHEFLQGMYYEGLGDLHSSREKYLQAHECYLEGSETLWNLHKKKSHGHYFVIAFARIKCQFVQNLLRLGRFKECLDHGHALIDLISTSQGSSGHFEQQYLAARTLSLLPLALKFSSNDKSHSLMTASLANAFKAWLCLFEGFPANQRIYNEFTEWFDTTATRELLSMATDDCSGFGSIPADSDVVREIKRLLAAIPKL